MQLCGQCGNTFKDAGEFAGHSCVTEGMKSPREERLKRLVESGGCSQEYYDQEMNKSKEQSFFHVGLNTISSKELENKLKEKV